MLNLSGTWKAATSPRKTAFTLVELLVVIGIVVLLCGLTVAASTALVERSEIRDTAQRLKLLDLALQEWEAATDRSLTLGLNGSDPDGNPDSRARFDLQADTQFNFVISEVVEAVARVPAAKSILAELSLDALYTYRQSVHPAWVRLELEKSQQDDRFVGKLAVLDAWGWPIYATHPGRLWRPEDGDYPARDDDGTIRTTNEKAFGIARGRRICFISAGPDNDFGDYRLLGQPGYDIGSIDDNVTSYAPATPPDYH